MSNSISLLAIVGVSLLCAAAEVLLKHASQSPQPFRTWPFLLGLAFFVLSTFAWVPILQHSRLAIAGAMYCVIVVSLVTLAGGMLFREHLHPQEIAGLVCAIISLVLLNRVTE